MSFNANTGTKKERGPEMPAGLHHAVCYMVVDLGTHDAEWKGEKKQVRKGMIGWEIPELRIEIERDGQKIDMPRVISAVWTISTGRKSNLRPILESWDGKELEGDYPDYDIETLIGRSCQLQIIHRESTKGGTYAHIKNVLPAPPGAALRAENEMVYFAFDDGKPLPRILADGKLQWIVTSNFYGMQDSHEYRAMTGSHDHEPDRSTANMTPAEEAATVVIDDDDMPF